MVKPKDKTKNKRLEIAPVEEWKPLLVFVAAPWAGGYVFISLLFFV